MMYFTYILEVVIMSYCLTSVSTFMVCLYVLCSFMRNKLMMMMMMIIIRCSHTANIWTAVQSADIQLSRSSTLYRLHRVARKLLLISLPPRVEGWVIWSRSRLVTCSMLLANGPSDRRTALFQLPVRYSTIKRARLNNASGAIGRQCCYRVEPQHVSYIIIIIIVYYNYNRTRSFGRRAAADKTVASAAA